MRLRPTHLIVPCYAAVTLLATWPLPLEFGRAIPAVWSGMDPYMQVFMMGWIWKVLPVNPAGLFNLPIFHPEPRALTYMDHMIGEAFLGWPALALTGSPAAAYNAVLVLSFVLSGWAAYRLFRLLGQSRGAGFLAGFLFAFGPYRFTHLSCLNQLQMQFIPLGLFFVVRFVRRKDFRSLAAAAATLVVQSYFGWYDTFHLAFAAALLFLFEMAAGRLRPGDFLKWRVALLTAVAALVTLPGLYPYLQQQSAMPHFRRTIGMTALWSVDLLDYVKVIPQCWFPQFLGWPRWELGLWPGWVAVLFAAWGLGALRGGPELAAAGSRSAESPGAFGWMKGGWLLPRLGRSLCAVGRWARRTSMPGYFLVLGVTGFILSLGPVLRVGGVRTLIPLPYAVLYFIIPGFSSMRVPARFAGLLLLAATFFAAVGYDRFQRRFPGRGRTWRAAVLMLFLAGSIVSVLSLPVPMVPCPDGRSLPPAYRWLADRPGNDPLLELPMPDYVVAESELHAKRQIYLLYHGKPRLDGVSGFVPPSYEVFRLVMQGFPSPGAIRAAARQGARYILFHYGDLSPEAGERIRRRAGESPQLRVAATFGDDVIYTIAGGEPGPVAE